jgi:hypothetical protein
VRARHTFEAQRASAGARAHLAGIDAHATLGPNCALRVDVAWRQSRSPSRLRLFLNTSASAQASQALPAIVAHQSRAYLPLNSMRTPWTIKANQ